MVKDKLFKIVLVVEALLCVLLTVLKASVGEVILAAVAFPFEQIGIGLRVLSLSGAVGNAFAVLLYLVVCLLPIIGLFLIRRKRNLLLEDGLLFALSVLLFFAIYYFVNPGILAEMFYGVPAGKIVLGSTIYSLVLAYLILRILRLFNTSEIGRLQRYLTVLLGLLDVMFVYLIFGAGVANLMQQITAMQAGNTGNEYLLIACYVFAAIQYLVDVLPYVFDVIVVFAGIRLLRSLVLDRFSSTTVLEAARLSRLCGTMLRITVLVIAAFNLLQLLFAKHIFNIHASLQIPLFSIAFVLAVLLFSRLVAENKMLKEDNDSII